MNRIYFIILTCVFLGSCARPIAKFSITESESVVPAKIVFQNESENAESYSWDFGDGSTSEEENPDHEYILSGRYDVALTAKKEKRKNIITKTVYVEAPKKCLVRLETEFGDMLIELYDNTPKHADNFTSLISKGFYSELLFHRIIEGFMIQGGDPDSKEASSSKPLGSGGPGYQIDAEINEDNFHVKGALAAARQGNAYNPYKKSSGSQFYIVQGNKVTDATLDQMEAKRSMKYPDDIRELYKEIGGTPFLDGEYTVFGRVIEGLEIIDKIAAVETSRGDRPVNNVVMNFTVFK